MMIEFVKRVLVLHYGLKNGGLIRVLCSSDQKETARAGAAGGRQTELEKAARWTDFPQEE